MQKFRDVLREHPVTTGFVGLIIMIIVFKALPGSVSDGYLPQCPTEAAVAFLAFVFIAFIAGDGAVRPSAQGMGFSMRKALYMLILAFLLGIFGVVGKIYTGAEIAPNWLGEVLSAALLCVFVGMFEEAVFRGLLFNGLLGKMGDTRKGLMWAAVISSVLFGFIHVYEQVADPASMTMLMWGEALGKTVQTGMMGFLMAAIYLKTRNIWTVAIIHGLNDFVLMVANALFGQTISASYVGGGGVAGMPYATLVMYAVFIVLYIPMVVSAVRILKKVEIPAKGFFKDTWDTKAGAPVEPDSAR